MKKRGQAAAEFLIIFGVVFFFFISFLGVIQYNISQKNLEKERIIIQNLALDVQNEIALAAGSSEGYYREFELPANILGKNYIILIDAESAVYIHIPGRASISYIVKEISATSNDLITGINIIEKKGGVVVINNP